MYFHTDCGHIIDEDYESPLVSEGGWNHFSHMYLSRCSECGDLYPYAKPLDKSVRATVQELIYRLLGTDHIIHVPSTKSKVKSIRLKNTDKQDLGVEINHKSIVSVNQYDKDVLIEIS